MSSTGSAVRIVKATLEKKSIERLIHKQLPCRFSIIKRFGIIGIGSSEDDKGHVIASIAGAPTVVIAIEDVETVATGQSGAAIISFRVTHGKKVGRVQTHEELEINLFCRKLVGELREEMLKRTSCA